MSGDRDRRRERVRGDDAKDGARAAHRSQFSEMPRLAIIFMKINELSISERKASITYVIENKLDNSRLACESQKTPGGKNEGFSHYVIENK